METLSVITCRIFGTALFRGILLLILSLSLTSLHYEDVMAKETAGTDEAIRTGVYEEYGKLPLYFIQNDGQVDKKVKFYEKGSGHATFFTKDGVYLNLNGSNKQACSHTAHALHGHQETKTKCSAETSDHAGHEYDNKTHATNIKITLLGAGKNPEIIAEGLQEGKVNYFIGTDRSKWRSNIPTYSEVLYRDAYPGIDLRFYGNNSQMEYDVVVSPGSDPSIVRFAYEGIEGLRITEEGDMEINLKDGKIVQKKPYIYQEIDGRRLEVAGGFKIYGENDQLGYAFEVGSYDKKHTLVIDPVISYGTYIGEVYTDLFEGIAVDVYGNAYMIGSTNSWAFPTTVGAYDETGPTLDNFDVVVTKLNATGSALVYSTFIGGANSEWGFEIALDASGNAYVTGVTEGDIDVFTGDPNPPGFPTTVGAYDTTFNGGIFDVFVTKLNATGSALLYSTYIGGANYDESGDIALDASGNAYVTGLTEGGFPTTVGAYDTTYNGGTEDVFVTKLNPAGGGTSDLVYSTYIGGSGSDYGRGITLDASNNAFVTGWAQGGFPTTTGAYDTAFNGSYDAFVTKLNSSGSSLTYSTYLGGSDMDGAIDVVVDTAGNAYMTGITTSWDSSFPATAFPATTGAYDTSHNGGTSDISDIFITKLNPAGGGTSDLVYSTYIGGSGDDHGHDIALDASNNAIITGMTSSTTYPTTTGAYDTTYNGGLWDTYLTKLNPAGGGTSDLVYSTYIGGSGGDHGHAIAFDVAGNAYVAGFTDSSTGFSNDHRGL